MNLCFGDFFCFSGSVVGSHICIDFYFQRLQYEGSNEFSQIWLITVVSHIPLVLTDHCASSIFSSRFGSTAGAGLFVKRAKNGFGSAVWLTAVDAQMIRDMEGIWYDDQNEIAKVFINDFIKRFTLENPKINL